MSESKEPLLQETSDPLGSYWMVNPLFRGVVIIEAYGHTINLNSLHGKAFAAVITKEMQPLGNVDFPDATQSGIIQRIAGESKPRYKPALEKVETAFGFLMYRLDKSVQNAITIDAYGHTVRLHSALGQASLTVTKNGHLIGRIEYDDLTYTKPGLTADPEVAGCYTFNPESGQVVQIDFCNHTITLNASLSLEGKATIMITDAKGDTVDRLVIDDPSYAERKQKLVDADFLNFIS